MQIKYDDDVASIPNIEQSGGMFGALGRKIDRADAATKARIGRAESGISETAFQRTKAQEERAKLTTALQNIGTPTQVNNSAISGRSKLDLLNAPMTESNIGKQGKFVTGADGKPKWEGLEGGWMRNEETGETFAVGANQGDPMRRVAADGQTDTGFQERTSLQNIQAPDSATSPYEITDSSLTPEETKRFMRTPVHGGSRARSGPGFGNRPESGWSPDYSQNAPEERMPRFTAPGFTGRAAQARIKTQEQKWLKGQKKSRDVTALEQLQQGEQTKRTLMDVGARREATAQRGLAAKQTASEKERVRQEDITRATKIRQEGFTRADTKEAAKTKRLDKVQKQNRYDKYLKQFVTPELFKASMPKEYDQLTLPSFTASDDLSNVKSGEKIILDGEIIIKG